MQEGSSREPLDRLKNENSLRMGLWRSSNTLLLPLVTVLQPVDFSVAREGGMRILQINTLQSTLSLPIFSLFSLYKHFPNYCKPLMNFLSSDQVMPTLFASVFVTFMERIFRGPYSIISLTFKIKSLPFNHHTIVSDTEVIYK